MKKIKIIIMFLAASCVYAAPQSLPIDCLSSSKIQNAKYFKDHKLLCLNGHIDSTTLYAFEKDFLPLDIQTVVLNSTGGTFYGGKEVSKLIRDRNITTVVPQGAKCMSNCVWVFSAGAQRVAGQNVRIGIHYVYRVINVQGKVAIDLDLTEQYLSGIDEYSAAQISTLYLQWSVNNGLSQEIDQSIDNIVDSSFITRSFWTPSIQLLYDSGLVTRVEPDQNEIRK
jgi:ATP-dependent protease ClpP protease subunit